MVQLIKGGERKLYKLSGHFSLLLLLFASSLLAESFSEFKRVQSESFEAFRDKKDERFNNYLKEQYKEYREYVSIPLYEKQKPQAPLTTREEMPKVSGPFVHIKLKEEKDSQSIPKTQATPVKSGLKVSYFGTELTFSVDEKFKGASYYPNTQKGVRNFFVTMASLNYENTLHDIKKYSQEMELNDWGVYLLIKKLAQKLYINRDEQRLFEWFMLNKLAYNVKVALVDKHIVLLINSKQLIYATPRYKLNGRYFYLLANDMRGEIKKIYTYTGEYPGAHRAFDFSLSKLPFLQSSYDSKSLEFKAYGKLYTIHFNYNKNILEFFSTYPQVDYEVYFSAPMEEQTYLDIAKDLKHYIDGKKASVALDFLLKFVQKAFVYEVDQKQFNKEKVMFSEETLVYNRSDCEDRAILFAYLVKKLLGFSVIGVKYADHMATALYIPLKGDSLRVGKRRYVIADPTYINATVGQSMPKYRSIQPQKFIIVK